jgi:hypothetical protein
VTRRRALWTNTPPALDATVLRSMDAFAPPRTSLSATAPAMPYESEGLKGLSLVVAESVTSSMNCADARRVARRDADANVGADAAAGHTAPADRGLGLAGDLVHRDYRAEAQPNRPCDCRGV